MRTRASHTDQSTPRKHQTAPHTHQTTPHTHRTTLHTHRTTPHALHIAAACVTSVSTRDPAAASAHAASPRARIRPNHGVASLPRCTAGDSGVPAPRGRERRGRSRQRRRARATGRAREGRPCPTRAVERALSRALPKGRALDIRAGRVAGGRRPAPRAPRPRAKSATRDPPPRATRAAPPGPDICQMPGPARTFVISKLSFDCNASEYIH